MEQEFLLLLKSVMEKSILVVCVASAISIALVVYMMLLGGLCRLDRSLGVDIDPSFDDWHSQRARYFSYGFKYLFGELNVPKSFGLHVLMWGSAITTLIVFTAIFGIVFYKYIEWVMGIVNSFPQTFINDICAAAFFYGQFVILFMIVVFALVLPRHFGKKFIIQNFTKRTYEEKNEYDPFTNQANNTALLGLIRAKKKPYRNGTFYPKGLLPKIVLCSVIGFDIFFKIFAVGVVLFFGINFGLKLL
jgi:hypothetical protein